MKFQEFKGKIVPNLLRKFRLTKTQAKKLICVITLCDAYGAIYPRESSKRAQWRLETKPNNTLHYFVHDLFLYAYNVKPLLRFRKSRELQFSELNGKICEKILKDLFKFTPTFKTSPAKSIGESAEEYLRQPQPTLKFLFTEPRWLQELAIRVIFDLEGCIVPRISIKKKKYKNKSYYQVQFEPLLEISLTHPTLVKQLHAVLKKLDFNPKIVKDLREWSKVGGMRITRKKDIIRFLEIGGSLTYVRIHKSKKAGIYNNNNFFKQTLLKASCELLKKYGTSKHFSTLEEAKKYVEYLKSELIKLRNKLQKVEEKENPGIAGHGIPGIIAF